jgi:hypothetical protein
MRIIQPEERAVSDERWAKELFREVKHPEDVPKSPDPTVSDAEFARGIERMLNDEVAQGWELVRETAEATLRQNPDDETAQIQMMSYQQWKRRQSLPPERRNAFVVTTAKPKAERVGVWARASDGQYYIRVARSEVGDKVKVRTSGGSVGTYKLTEKVANNLYKGRGV